MTRVYQAFAAMILVATVAVAGDDASGPIAYQVDLGSNFSTHQFGESELKWSRSLVENLNYEGRVVHFVRTTLPLSVDGKTHEGLVYQAVEEPDVFFVIPGDAMLKVGAKYPLSPGVGGFSMHAPDSLDFIVCLNFHNGGVPFHSGSKVSRGQVTWNGRDWRRF